MKYLKQGKRNIVTVKLEAESSDCLWEVLVKAYVSNLGALKSVVHRVCSCLCYLVKLHN